MLLLRCPLAWRLIWHRFGKVGAERRNAACFRFRGRCGCSFRARRNHRDCRDCAEIFALESLLPDFLVCCRLAPSAVRHDVIAWRSRIANLAMRNSSILITGGTGSFGSRFVPMALRRHDPVRLVVHSRDEMKQREMAKACANDGRVRLFLGDVRDKARLCRAMDGIGRVVHAAAPKIGKRGSDGAAFRMRSGAASMG